MRLIANEHIFLQALAAKSLVKPPLVNLDKRNTLHPELTAYFPGDLVLFYNYRP